MAATAHFYGLPYLSHMLAMSYQFAQRSRSLRHAWHEILCYCDQAVQRWHYSMAVHNLMVLVLLVPLQRTRLVHQRVAEAPHLV